MPLRKCEVAGMFYPDGEMECIDLIMYCMNKAGKVKRNNDAVGAMVPHAGWVYSGHVAAKALMAIEPTQAPDLFVILGAVHHPGVDRMSVFPSGAWSSPLGPVDVDSDAADAVLAEKKIGAIPSARAHDKEHSIEVIVPFIAYMFPEAKILPIACPPSHFSFESGAYLAKSLRKLGKRIFFIASSDLTHYGFAYGLTSQGIGPEAEKWVMETNDGELLRRLEILDGERIVEHIEATRCACGPGAIAVTLGACMTMGAKRGVLMEHTNSLVATRDSYSKHNFVSYASMIFVC